MPPSMTDQQAELRRKARRRLIGATVLVLLLVIFLPKILDHEPKPIGQDVPIRMPETTAAVQTSPPANTNSEPQPQASVATADSETSSQPSNTQTTEVASVTNNTVTAVGEFVVQVGAFSSNDKADQAQRKVAAAGLPVFTETIDVDGQARIRVRAGPFEQRADAEAALEKLNAIGFGGKLMMK